MRKKHHINADIGIIYNNGKKQFQTVDFVLKIERFNKPLVLDTFEEAYERAKGKPKKSEEQIWDSLTYIGNGHFQDFLMDFIKGRDNYFNRNLCPDMSLEYKSGVIGNIRGHFLEIYCKNVFQKELPNAKIFVGNHIDNSVSKTDVDILIANVSRDQFYNCLNHSKYFKKMV